MSILIDWIILFKLELSVKSKTKYLNNNHTKIKLKLRNSLSDIKKKDTELDLNGI